MNSQRVHFIYKANSKACRGVKLPKNMYPTVLEGFLKHTVGSGITDKTTMGNTFRVIEIALDIANKHGYLLKYHILQSGDDGLHIVERDSL